MRLFEEYFRRHNISLPVAHHCKFGSLVLRTDNTWTSRWAIVTIAWEDHPYRPGQYVICMDSPVHDGYVTGDYFTGRNPITKKWHEYEDFFLDWSKSLTGAKPMTGDQIWTSIWEMFVYSHDGWFNLQPPGIQNTLFESLDEDNTQEARHVAYQTVASHLSRNHPAVFDCWKKKFIVKTQYYSDWLARLVEGH